MSDAVALVPRLRFPEFRQVGGWTLKRLKDVCEVNPANPELPERFVYVDLESVEAGKLTARNTISKGEAPSRAQRLLHPDDVIFQIVRPYQRNNFHFKISEGLDYVASTGYAQLRAKDSANFLFQAVHVDSFVDRVIAKCTGSSYPAINSSDLAEVPLFIPQPSEQRKIADCLSSLDELIAALARKVDALKTHKKGLMQQLFPREGETQPRLRFPEFRDAGEWEVKSLNRLFTIGSGRDYKHLSPGSVPVYGSGGYMLSVDKFLYDGESVCIGRKGTINKPMFITGKFWTVDTLFYTHSFQKCLPKFIYAIFQQIEWLKHNEAGGVPSLSKAIIEKIEVAVPLPQEQQRIADCLTSLDNLITAATQKFETLKTHKKGLMQQLFPSAEAVQA